MGPPAVTEPILPPAEKLLSPPVEVAISEHRAGRPMLPQQLNSTPPRTADPRTAIERVVAYFAQLGVGSDTALRMANTLDRRIDPEEIDPARRTVSMLEAFDRWADELPTTLGMSAQADRVAFVVATHLGRLLNQFPDALEQPQALAEALRPHLDARPHGVLPNWPRQKMHRQPLGELPGVLQGEFWSGTYRWVVPVGASTKRMLRGHKKILTEANPASALNTTTAAAASPGVSGGRSGGVAVEGPAVGE